MFHTILAGKTIEISPIPSIYNETDGKAVLTFTALKVAKCTALKVWTACIVLDTSHTFDRIDIIRNITAHSSLEMKV